MIGRIASIAIGSHVLVFGVSVALLCCSAAAGPIAFTGPPVFTKGPTIFRGIGLQDNAPLTLNPLPNGLSAVGTLDFTAVAPTVVLSWTASRPFTVGHDETDKLRIAYDAAYWSNNLLTGAGVGIANATSSVAPGGASVSTGHAGLGQFPIPYDPTVMYVTPPGDALPEMSDAVGFFQLAAGGYELTQDVTILIGNLTFGEPIRVDFPASSVDSTIDPLPEPPSFVAVAAILGLLALVRRPASH